MNNSRAAFILKALATGHHPDNNQSLLESSVLVEPDIIRALFLGAHALEGNTSIINHKQDDSDLPSRAGKPWDEDEDDVLRDEFNSGKSIKDMSEDHSRTKGAIQARLVKLGLMDERGKDPR